VKIPGRKIVGEFFVLAPHRAFADQRCASVLQTRPAAISLVGVPARTRRIAAGYAI